MIIRSLSGGTSGGNGEQPAAHERDGSDKVERRPRAGAAQGRSTRLLGERVSGERARRPSPGRRECQRALPRHPDVGKSKGGSAAAVMVRARSVRGAASRASRRRVVCMAGPEGRESVRHAMRVWRSARGSALQARGLSVHSPAAEAQCLGCRMAPLPA